MSKENSPLKEMKLTPMMEQYKKIKEDNTDAILFYRIGDFYEMFFEDAVTASKELEIALTARSCGNDSKAPMCGVPFHAADQHIGRLVSKGYKVVICEQLEDPATAKTIVDRGIIRVITPGTVTDNTQLDDKKNNYLCAICTDNDSTGIAFADISTGEMSITSYEGKFCTDEILNSLGMFKPREIMTNGSFDGNPSLHEYIYNKLNAFVNEKQTQRFDYQKAFLLISKQLPESRNKISERGTALVCAVGAIVDYINETQKTENVNISKIKFIDNGQYLELDISTRRNLELCESMRQREKRGTLLWVLDKTKTSAGARLLRQWIEQPLVNASQIGRRQKAVSELCTSFIEREELSEQLRHFLDLDRLMTKLVYGTANARDLRSIASTISLLPAIKELTENFRSEELSDIHYRLDTLSDVRDLIDSAISDDPPFSVREGGMIKKGYNADVDELSEIVHDSKDYVKKMAEKEKERTGIKNLKISYNKVFGYYIEVTNSNLAEVPKEYIRKQTLVNAERYITEELKEKEALIIGSSDRLTALEYELFTQIRQAVASQVKRVQDASSYVAKLDCYISLADVAVKNGYVCPEIEYGNTIKIKDGRHPVVEHFAKDGCFVPNDTLLDVTHNRLALITGPNMAGKSTYMRQVALITLMAQIGSFVPASEARIGIVDKIFTRVGASDDLASGTSTFMLEMNEVAYILKNATARSLVIYDEIGRGTSTFDGMSIAKAVAEYTASKKLGAKTLFATHYHELTELEKETDGIVNYNIAAKKKGDDIIFLRKIVRGGTDDSYGIEVAKLAGMPNEVIKRAKEVLREITENASIVPKKHAEPELNPNITFDNFKADEVRERLINTDINLLTPMEALNLLAELKRLAE